MTQTFFMHIGKTAGSSVNALLAAHFGDRFIDHVEAKPHWLEQIDSFDCLAGHMHYPTVRNMVGDRPFKFITVMREPIAQFRSHLNWIKVLGSNPKLRMDTPPHILELSDELVGADLSDPEQALHFITREAGSLHRLRLFDNYQSRYFHDMYLDRRFSLADFKTAISNMDNFDFVGVSEDPFGISQGIQAVLQIGSDLHLPHANVQEYKRTFDREAWRSVLGDWIGYDCALYELVRDRRTSLDPASAAKLKVSV